MKSSTLRFLKIKNNIEILIGNELLRKAIHINVRTNLPFREQIISDLIENKMNRSQAEKFVDVIDDSILDSIRLKSSKHLSLIEYENVSIISIWRINISILPRKNNNTSYVL